ncbi:DUF3263 domain-containing protein [Herbiconiux sp. KACC 21604]|uniref:DUF3263 domain-containing protein n=1 Tax=unclassified Herbiconiux TaxID=2618217 RepID=UPI00149188D3|nr:DUF3263 domain-containing protein [Herbiconiux sp. SALV-R1]QJU54307.1 DUF3263 domain-containing protein [Herbiconiux sp. SALV-R1]WPO85377.1 DUF3263 domain-containing protein [Herbiconiux sp. KACC 21604]
MLTYNDRIILDFERRWIDRPEGAREEAIRRTFGWTYARYVQRLNQLLDTQAAMAAYPQLVYRLRARIEARRGMG